MSEAVKLTLVAAVSLIAAGSWTLVANVIDAKPGLFVGVVALISVLGGMGVALATEDPENGDHAG